MQIIDFWCVRNNFIYFNEERYDNSSIHQGRSPLLLPKFPGLTPQASYLSAAIEPSSLFPQGHPSSTLLYSLSRSLTYILFKWSSSFGPAEGEINRATMAIIGRAWKGIIERTITSGITTPPHARTQFSQASIGRKGQHHRFLAIKKHYRVVHSSNSCLWGSH